MALGWRGRAATAPRAPWRGLPVGRSHFSSLLLEVSLGLRHEVGLPFQTRWAVLLCCSPLPCCKKEDSTSTVRMCQDCGVLHGVGKGAQRVLPKRGGLPSAPQDTGSGSKGQDLGKPMRPFSKKKMSVFLWDAAHRDKTMCTRRWRSGHSIYKPGNVHDGQNATKW